jgi:hypothetical protein
MKRVRKHFVIAAVIGVAVVIVVWALLGIGFAAIAAVGLIVIAGLVLPGMLIVKDEEQDPWRQEAEHPGEDHGYHPTR